MWWVKLVESVLGAFLGALNRALESYRSDNTKVQLGNIQVERAQLDKVMEYVVKSSTARERILNDPAYRERVRNAARNSAGR